MKLFIDTSNSQDITVRVGKTTIQKPSHNKASQFLLQSIKEAAEIENIKLQHIKEIEVNTGPGSFTGLRVGVSVANALGWALKIPVNGKSVKKDGPVEPTY
ncbi:MAG: tRNA (adenosine(37)-N6)-threonylcarbamoyltransferase complex dimerization subunit type 1 TsaB [Patescibacteria group bacterium]